MVMNPRIAPRPSEGLNRWRESRKRHLSRNALTAQRVWRAASGERLRAAVNRQTPSPASHPTRPQASRARHAPARRRAVRTATDPPGGDGDPDPDPDPTARRIWHRAAAAPPFAPGQREQLAAILRGRA